jgi:hypothetical protein
MFIILASFELSSDANILMAALAMENFDVVWFDKRQSLYLNQFDRIP